MVGTPSRVASAGPSASGKWQEANGFGLARPASYPQTGSRSNQSPSAAASNTLATRRSGVAIVLTGYDVACNAPHGPLHLCQIQSERAR